MNRNEAHTIYYNSRNQILLKSKKTLKYAELTQNLQISNYN